ncbi:MAG TPA: VWA domain-containing protein [Blastocatellia bacterium]|jgi:Ca-activated chloride channel family protein|nr:VWA domain-containing protein [Blastocatellia bacterium]
MRFTKYSKWTGVDWDSISLEDLLDRLADFLLQSGFEGSYYDDWDDRERSLEALRDAIMRALMEELLSEAELEQFADADGNLDEERLEELINRLIERLIEEGYITVGERPSQNPASMISEKGTTGKPIEKSVKFEITDKGLDFLGFKALKELVGSLGKSSFGRHDTNNLSTGIEASASPKRYEFGDVLNLDVSATLRSAIQREGLGVPLALEYSDLMVHQTDYQSSCATVLMLDCSHSMILYGEDRFTPAKRVALALTHLIRTQYPGDSLRVVLFHDSAEEIPLAAVARAQVGPYHTNTREGLRLARRILASQRKDMKQIIMITDGKPSAMTLDNGRIYKNPMGLDPRILSETFKEVAACRRSGIMINTFMLADDYYLVDFVKKVTEICRGKAYFTTTMTLGQYILMDYLKRRTTRVH